MYLRTIISLLIAAFVPTVAIAVLVEKLGSGSNAMFLIGAFLYLPFVLGAMLALAVRKKRWLSWLVLLTLLLISCDEIIGIYGAFFRTPARGASDLIYRPLSQTLVIAVVAIVFGGIVFLGRKVSLGKPTKTPERLAN